MINEKCNRIRNIRILLFWILLRHICVVSVLEADKINRAHKQQQNKKCKQKISESLDERSQTVAELSVVLAVTWLLVIAASAEFPEVDTCESTSRPRGNESVIAAHHIVCKCQGHVNFRKLCKIHYGPVSESPGLSRKPGPYIKHLGPTVIWFMKMCSTKNETKY